MLSLCNTCANNFKVIAALKRKVGDPTVKNDMTATICLIHPNINYVLQCQTPANYEIQTEEGAMVVRECSHYTKK